MAGPMTCGVAVSAVSTLRCCMRGLSLVPRPRARPSLHAAATAAVPSAVRGAAICSSANASVRQSPISPKPTRSSWHMGTHGLLGPQSRISDFVARRAGRRVGAGPRPAEAIAQSAPSRSSHSDEAGAVVELGEESSESYEEFVQSAPVVLVLFHAPWCGHCERVRPEWRRAAAMLAEREEPARLAAVDTSLQEDLALGLGVQQLPAMRLYVGGRLQPRRVDVRRAEDIVELVRSAAAAAGQQAESAKPSPPPSGLGLVRLGRDELKPFLSKKKHAFVLYYKPGESGDSDRLVDKFERASGVLERAAATRVAREQDGAAVVAADGGDASSVSLVAVDCADEPVLCHAMLSDRGVRPTTPVIKYYHFLDRPGGDHDYDGQLRMDDLARFVRSRVGAGGAGGAGGGDPDPDGSAHWQDVHHREAVVLLNDATFDATLARSSHVLVFFYAPWCNHCSLVKHAYAAAAHELAEGGMRGCMAAVEYSSNPLLEKRLGLEFLPAFKLFNKREFIEDHHKLRTKDDFVYLMRRISEKNS